MMKITCKQFDEVVHGFVRMELLDVAVREAVLDHASHCDSCNERMADAAALAEISESLGRSVRSEETPARVETALLAEFRKQRRRASWRTTLEWAGVGAAAAVVLVLLWTAGARFRGERSPIPARERPTASRQPLDARLASGSKQDESRSQSGAENSSATPSESYLASDFVPVPFTGGITADDPGMVVRVQLTRASLAQLGYPVAETPDEELIRADVLVGEDGWPRGVKLVQ